MRFGHIPGAKERNSGQCRGVRLRQICRPPSGQVPVGSGGHPRAEVQRHTDQSTQAAAKPPGTVTSPFLSSEEVWALPAPNHDPSTAWNAAPPTAGPRPTPPKGGVGASIAQMYICTACRGEPLTPMPPFGRVALRQRPRRGVRSHPKAKETSLAH